MIIDRDKLLCLIVTAIGLLTLVLNDVNANLSVINITNTNNNHDLDLQHEARSLFSPRIDYNEWMPVGRGDPLKNDPTYDYSPPVLDRVRYWGETNKDKKEILLLGVSSKRQNHKKENNQSNTVRRNYYPSHTLHHLPTRLIPPPLQTIPPTTKQTSTESYHNPYSHSSSYNNLNHNWNLNSVHYDTHADESINYVGLTHTERPSNIKSSFSNYGQYYTTASRKPWIYELLQKEITKPSYSPPIVSSSSSPLAPLTPSYSANYFMTPSKNVFESHISLNPTSVNYVTASFTTEKPEPTYFQPTIPTTSARPTSPTPTSTDSFTSASYKQKEYHKINSVHGPMYLIIQGHSKVKTYGLKDNNTDDHQPKIVPVASKEEPVIKHVVPKDDSGKTVEIKHLHKKVTESTTKEKLKFSTTAAAVKNSTIMITTTTNRPTSSANITSTTIEQSPMQSLLSLLDSSLGNFFLDNFNNEDNNITTTPITITTKKLDTTSTTNKNCTSSTDSSNDVRERRQIFDYDQLPESSIKEMIESGDEYYDYDGTKFAYEPKSSSLEIESETKSIENI